MTTVDVSRLARIQGAGRSLEDNEALSHDDAVWLTAHVRNLQADLDEQRRLYAELKRDRDVLRERLRCVVAAVRNHWWQRKSDAGPNDAALWEGCSRVVELDGPSLDVA
jgi:hypothetical protein